MINVGKEQLYAKLRDEQLIRWKNAGLSEDSIKSNLSFFHSWWGTIADLSQGQNVIEVTFFGGENIAKASHAMYHLASCTKKVINGSFNGTRIIMVDTDG